MAQAAKLGALASENAGLVGFKANGVDTPRNHIALAVEARDPPGVDDIAARTSHEHFRASFDHHLAGGDNGLFDTATTVLDRVVNFPPPLLAGDVNNAFGVVGLGKIHDRANRRDGNADQNQRRKNREADFEDRLTVSLLRDRLAAIAVLPECERQHGKDNDADHTSNTEHNPVEVIDHPGIRALGLPGVLRCISCTASEQHRERARNKSANEP